MKECKYCGIELDISGIEQAILLSKTALMSLGHNLCPKCGTTYQRGNYFCSKCGQVLLIDKYLKTWQNEERTLQKQKRASLPKDLRKKLDSDEYLYGYHLGMYPQAYLITDKRVLVRIKLLFWSKPIMVLQYKDISDIYKPKKEYGLFNVEVESNSKEIKYFKFNGSKDCRDFYKQLNSAYEHHLNHKKNYRALLFLTDLDRENNRR